jgi:hypothetical protein
MLGWHPLYRGNHYLCEVAGLSVIAAYLAPDEDVSRWRARATRALAEEARRQFGQDGGNIEASTGYHRLSGEALIFGTALAGHAFDASHYARIGAIARFIAETARPDGTAPQIGDQDGGRFLKLTPCFARAPADGADNWDEVQLDHRHVVAAAAGLLGSEALEVPAHWRLEQALVSGLRQPGPPVEGAARTAPAIGDRNSWHRLQERLRRLPATQRARFTVGFGAGPRRAAAFPEFGLYVLRAGTSYLCVRCGPIGNHGLGAHAHNDALSIELVCGGRDVVRDPGSYLYTPLPAERDRYRSVRAHFAPRIAGREPGSLALGLFRLGDEAQARCLYFGEDGFLGTHTGYGAPVHRLIAFTDTMLVIEDFSEGDALEPVDAVDADHPFAPLPFSPKYGVRLP